MVGRSRADARALSVVILLAAAATSSGRASADETKRQCAASAENGQRLRDEGKPLAARAELVVCGRQACPAVIRAHCARWLEQVEAAVPSVVFQARAGAPGHSIDLTDVEVAIDGVGIPRALDGQPHRVEPGQHTFRYTRHGSAPVESSILLVAGEKNRLLAVTFASDDAASGGASSSRGAAPSVSVAADASASSGTPSSSGARSAIRPAAWVFAGLAVVGGAGFAYFGATGKSDLDSLRATCAGHCTQAAVSSAWNRLIVSDVSLAVGVVSAGLATWLWLSPRHEEPPPEPGASSGLLFGPRDHGATLGWQGVF